MKFLRYTKGGSSVLCIVSSSKHLQVTEQFTDESLHFSHDLCFKIFIIHE